LFSTIGGLTVAGFALAQGGSQSLAGDLMMVAAVVLCGLGYAEGATLSRRLGGWQVISWALLVALPVMAAIMVTTMRQGWSGIGPPAWLSLAYVSIFSMLVGFVFWYRGLALGGIAAVSQLQLLQPFFGWRSPSPPRRTRRVDDDRRDGNWLSCAWPRQAILLTRG